MQLPSCYPDLNDDRDEFIKIDMHQVGVDGHFTVLRVVSIPLRKPCLPQVFDGEAPHVVKDCTPAAHAVERGISVGDDCWISWNEEANGAMPEMMVQVRGKRVTKPH